MTPRTPFFMNLRDLLDREGEVTLGELADAAGEQTAGLLILLLALPSLLPGLNVGAAPIGGLALAALGWQMARGRKPWLPAGLRARKLHPGHVKAMLARFEQALGRFRLSGARSLNRRGMGLLVAWTGLLLALPVPLPFGNIAPAGALALQGAALLEERPLLGWLGLLASLAVTLYFALSFDLILRALHKGLHLLHRMPA